MKKQLKLLLLVALLASYCLPSFGQASTEGRVFWATLTIGDNNENKKEFKPYIAISSKKACKVIITNPRTGYRKEKDVLANDWTTIKDIPLTEWYPSTDTDNSHDPNYSENPYNNGLLIQSDEDISVYVANRMKYSFDASNILPVTALGSEYITQDFPPSEQRSVFAILATEDDTKIDITPTAQTVKGKTGTFQITLQRGETYQVMSNSDNKYLLSGGNDLQVNIVDINSQSLLRNFRLDSIVTSLDINYANNILAVGTYDNLMYLFDIRSRNLICKMICHSEPITDVKISNDSTVVYSTSYDSFFRIWDLFRFSALKTFSLENSPSINNILLLENENYVLLNNFNSSLEIMDIINEVQVKKFTGHKHNNYCTDCCLYTYYTGKNKQNDLVFTGDEECNLCYYNVRDEGGKCNKICLKDNIKIDNNNKLPLVVDCLDIYKSNNENIIACSIMGDLNNSILLFKQDKKDT